MFLGSQHQASVVETEDAAHAFDLLDFFLCICCCLASLVPVLNLWSRYISGCLTCQYREWLRNMTSSHVMFEWYAGLMISFLELSDTRTNYKCQKHTDLFRKIPNFLEYARNGDRHSLKRLNKVVLVDALQIICCFNNKFMHALSCNKYLQHQHR